MAETTQKLLDFGPSAAAMAEVVMAIPDAALDAPTPCPDYSVGDLADHVAGLTRAFTAAAGKQALGGGPSADGSRLPAGWRERISADLEELVRAWRDPAAYEGLTMAGPVEMPGSAAALVALDEIIVHAWDLSRAIGRPYRADPAAVTAVAAWVESFPAARDGGLFGPVVEVGADADPMDRLIGLTGRDPGWTPPPA